jgi:hypothetical protein
VQDKTGKLLTELDPAKVVPPSEQMKPADVAADSTTPELIPPTAAAAPRAEPAKVVDASRKLLSMADPAVKLPEFRAVNDAVTAPPPPTTAINPAAAVSADQLRSMEQMLSAGGSGLIAGAVPADTDLLPGAAAGAMNDKGTGSVSPATPPMKLPDVLAAVPMTLPALPAVPVTLPESNEKAVHLDDDFDYLLRVYEQPPNRGFLGFGASEPQTPWFEVRITPRRSLHRLKPLSKDVVWVLDTSESISANWVAAQKQGVEMALDSSLSPGDRFNIVMFKDTVSVLSSEGPLPATPENFDRARKFLNAAESSGYTDVNRALGQLITRGVAADRVYNIVLVSDGVPTRGAVDARAIINMITRENDLVAGIYCVGIGESIDKRLLEFLAYRNKGFVVYPENSVKGATAIRELAGRLKYPILKDATFDAAGVPVSTIYPRIPRDIYQGEPLSLYGRVAEGAQRLSMRLTGTSGPQILDFTFTLPFSQAKPGDEATARQWAFWKLHHLYSEIIRQGETPQLKAEIDELRRRYGLKTAY